LDFFVGRSSVVSGVFLLEVSICSRESDSGSEVDCDFNFRPNLFHAGIRVCAFTVLGIVADGIMKRQRNKRLQYQRTAVLSHDAGRACSETRKCTQVGIFLPVISPSPYQFKHAKLSDHVTATETESSRVWVA
jgi:hypothetical protein